MLASTLSSHINLTMSLHFWGSQGFLCNHSWSWHPTLSHFKLSAHSQEQSSSLICPLNSVFQHPDPACTRGCVSQVGLHRTVASTICVGLYPAYHRLIFAHSPEPLNLLFSYPADCFANNGASQGAETSPLLQVPSKGRGLISFPFYFFLSYPVIWRFFLSFQMFEDFCQ